MAVMNGASHGQGLHLSPNCERPLPLRLAALALREQLAALDGVPDEVSALQPDGYRLLRLEQPVAEPGQRGSVTLDWMEAQAGLGPRVVFGTRDTSLLLAGVGAAHFYTDVGNNSSSPSNGADGGDNESRAILPELSVATSSRLRYVGGIRFDSFDPQGAGAGGSSSSSSCSSSTNKKSAISEEWEAFGNYSWVLPRVELSFEEASASVNPHSSCGSNTLTEESSIRSVQGCLAVQLRYRSDVPGSCWAGERRRAMEALTALRPLRGASDCRDVHAQRREQGSQAGFEDGVRRALKAFADKQLEKVVLARRVDLRLSDDVDPVALLRHVMGGSRTQRRTYLFMYEPFPGEAFVSLTPERLCRVQGSDLWTEAVAGTWPLADFEKIGETALLASSEKTTNEHQLVGNYIQNQLQQVSEHIKVCDTHILKLKHLVHIKQSYQAIAKKKTGSSKSGGERFDDPFGLTHFFCQHMSPTPAVGGIPLNDARRFISDVEPFDRGYYAAPCGILHSHGSELIVALRSCLVRNQKLLHVYAGAGIVPGSEPSEEYAEISLKMQQFTQAFPVVDNVAELPLVRLKALKELPNMNTLWSTIIVEECVRNNVTNFVICAGSRSTPLVVAVARSPHTVAVVNHDERSGAYYALGWAKATGKPVGIIVTSGTAVANLVPAVVEAAQAQVPLLLFTADRPSELMDTGANQTIRQPGMFRDYVRWEKDMPTPATDYPLQALLGDIDLAIGHSLGRLSGSPGPVQLNFRFRENLAPDGGAVRGQPNSSSAWDPSYVDTATMHRWCSSRKPRSTYAEATPALTDCNGIEELIEVAQKTDPRIVVLVGTLRTQEEVLLTEEVAHRLNAIVFADITSGLRQRPGVVHYADQLLTSPLLAGDLMQLDALVHVGGPLVSARLAAFAKASAPELYIRVGPPNCRMDQDHLVTHHLPGGLLTLSETLAKRGLQASPPNVANLWRHLSEVAGKAIESTILEESSASGDAEGTTTGLSGTPVFSEPFVARTVAKLLCTGGQLQISSSMPIRDLDFFSPPSVDSGLAPLPPAANRGASGIDGVIASAAGFCKGLNGSPSTLIIGDVATIHDLNSLQQLAATPSSSSSASTTATSKKLNLTIILVNNGGGGIFNFLPIGKHRDVLSQYFNEPHSINFESACQAFGLQYTCCETAQDFQLAYAQTQARSNAGPHIIEARVKLGHEENVALHQRISAAVARRVRAELLAFSPLSWTLSASPREKLESSGKSSEPTNSQPGNSGASTSTTATSTSVSISNGAGVLGGAASTVVLLHGWLGERGDWTKVSDELVAAGHQVLAVDVPGHGPCKGCSGWEAASLYTLPFAVEAVVDLLDRLNLDRPLLVGYSLGGRVAMCLASQHPGKIRGVLALSANPGLESVSERRQRLATDFAVSQKLTKPGNLPTFLKNWYSVGLWGDLAKRNPEKYESMLKKRLRVDPEAAVCPLLGMSLGRQGNLWGLTSNKNFWYAYGSLDSKFSAIADKVRSRVADPLTSASRVTSFEAGHAVVEEKPQEVANLISTILSDLQDCEEPKIPAERAPSLEGVRLTACWSEALELPLTAPLLLSRGSPTQRRSGRLVLLRAEVETATGRTGFHGLGEVSPLPMFHKESLADAEQQLSSVLEAWNQRPPTVPLNVRCLDGKMTEFLESACPRGVTLLPSVRSGLESALLHLLSRVVGDRHLGLAIAASHQQGGESGIGVNALIAREEDLRGALAGATVVKVKVGRNPQEDAAKVESLASQGRGKLRLRLDANQGWTVEQAAEFISGLSDETTKMIEYLEEPVEWPTNLTGAAASEAFLADWERLSELSGRRIAFAADESLTEGQLKVEQLAGCRAPIAALVLKPALQGLEETATLAAKGLKQGRRPILTSAFESGVALSHFSLLAAALAPGSGDAGLGCGDWEVSASHGMGTFTRLAEDVLDPPFADLVESRRGYGWYIDAMRCQEALTRTADALASSLSGDGFGER